MLRFINDIAIYYENKDYQLSRYFDGSSIRYALLNKLKAILFELVYVILNS